jgi:hypothetical protein
MDAISARLTAIAVLPMPLTILPYTREAGPPLRRLNWKEVPAASQAAWRVKPKLTIAAGLM